MKFASVVLTFILILMPLSAALAQDSITIKITLHTPAPKMLAVKVELTSSQTEWNIGEVEPNKTKQTSPAKEWCTITNTGNCPVNLNIKGENAVDVANPGYEWALSDDGTNGKDRYALWYWIARYSPDYTLITTSERPFYNGNRLEEGGAMQFGLKLLTPTEFEPGRQMETSITISVVIASDEAEK